MRVVISNCYFAPAWGYGGPTRLLYELSRELRVRGHQVTVITSDAADGFERYLPGEIHEDGIRVIRLRTISQRWAYRYKKFIAPTYPFVLRRLLSSTDVLHLNGSRDLFVSFGSRVAVRSSVPYVLAAHGSLPACGRGWKAIAKPLFDVLVTGDTVKRAGCCLAQTRREAELYLKFGATRERVAIVPLAADGQRFLELPSRGQFRRHLGLSNDERMILFVGRLHYLKGLDILMIAFRELVRDTPARLVIVGRDDGYEAAARAFVSRLALEDKVIFAAALYGRDVLSAYVDADVFALTPRHYEETTLAGIEACFCGTQVVVTEQAEIPYLEESGAGWVVRNDTKQIAEALRQALDDQESIKRRGEAARRMAYTYFDWRVTLPSYLRAYKVAQAALEQRG